jgi:hypothetical protein
MTFTFPAGVEGEGNVKVAFLPAIADVEAPSLAGDLAAAIDLSCYVTGDGFTPGGTQEEKSDRRLCSRQTFGAPGAITYTIGELTYVYDPQDPSNTGLENEAYSELTPDRVGFIMVRFGIAFETDWAAAQIVDIYPAIMGAQFKNPPVAAAAGGGGTSKLTVRQTPYVSGPASLDVALAA